MGNIGKTIKRYPYVIEVTGWITGIIFLIYLLRSMLIFGNTTLSHDNILWNYPIFQFFAENIINGNFPLWNPFCHGGEPFYPILTQVRLLEPITLLTIYLGKFLTDEIVILFNWNRIIQSLIMAFGIYIVLRQWAKDLFITLSLIPILLYSSFMLGSFQQDAILNQFLWAPFITYFLLRIVYYRDYRWHNWLFLSSLIGLNWQSYFFTGIWIFFLFFLLGIILFRRDYLLELFKADFILLKFILLGIVILLMALPSITLLLESDKYVFPARMIDFPHEGSPPRGSPLQYESNLASIVGSGIRMPYSFTAYTGSFSTIWNFIHIISPDGNAFVKFPGRTSWGNPSEAYMYIGLLPWAIAILGMIVGRHDLKRVWLLTLAGFSLLMLGPSGGLHRFLYCFYPPLWFVRHTHAFVLFFIFAFLYFYILGFNHLFSTWGRSLFRQYISQGILSYIFRNNIISKWVSIILFSSCTIFSFYLITNLSFPAINWIFCFFLIIFIVGCFLKRDLHEDGLFISLIVSHITVVLILTPNPIKFVGYTASVLGIPIVLFISKRWLNTAMRGLPFVLLFFFSTNLTFDLIYTFKNSSSLYKDINNPVVTGVINTRVEKPFLCQDRAIYPQEIKTSYERGMRYLELLYRRPFAFSSIRDGNTQLQPDTFEYALKSVRWSSFLLLRNYFELIHMDVSPVILEEIFAIGKPLFQFKQRILCIDEADVSDLFGQLGTTKSVELLQESIIINENTNSLSGKDVVSYIEGKEEDGFLYVIKRYGHDYFDMEVFLNKDGFLYWADGYDKDWHAYINKKEVPVYRANINFKAIYIPKGANNITFLYNPILFKIGLFIFYGVFIVCMIIVLIIKTSVLISKF